MLISTVALGMLITNFSKSKRIKNIKFGATADTFLITYLVKHIEQTFRLRKRIDDGLQLTRRHDLFMISLTIIPSNIILRVMKTKGIDLTMLNNSNTIFDLDIVQESEKTS